MIDRSASVGRGSFVGAALMLLAATVSGCGMTADFNLDALSGARSTDQRVSAPASAANPALPALEAAALDPSQIATSTIPQTAPPARAPIPRAAPRDTGPSLAHGGSRNADGSCKTVKLFDRRRPVVAAGVSPEQAAYSGHWGPAFWDNKLCHELVVEEIRADGTARVVDLQGYYLPWNRWPTAFRREATFLPDGSLLVDQGRMGRSIYRLQNGRLHGVYDWGVARVGAVLDRQN